MKQFLIFELNSAIKKMDITEIMKSIRTSIVNTNRKVLKKLSKEVGITAITFVSNLEIYLPFRELKRGRYKAKNKDYYINGYGFLEFHPELNYFFLDRLDFIERLLKDEDEEFLELLPESVIRQEQEKMNDYFSSTFREGQLVQVVNGNFSNMPSRVIGYNKDTKEYTVIIATRSNTWKLEIPSVFLEVREEDLLEAGDLLDEEVV